jgi:hypothetical protein
VLEGSGISDLSNPSVKDKYLSPLLSKCPAYLTDICPKDSLEHALQFLETWDDTSGSLADGFAATTLNSKPSIQYYLNVQSFKTNMPNGVICTEHMNIAQSLAWEALKHSFPPDFRVYVNLLDIRQYPTVEQLRKLNESWQTYNLKHGVPISAVGDVSVASAENISYGVQPSIPGGFPFGIPTGATIKQTSPAAMQIVPIQSATQATSQLTTFGEATIAAFKYQSEAVVTAINNLAERVKANTTTTQNMVNKNQQNQQFRPRAQNSQNYKATQNQPRQGGYQPQQSQNQPPFVYPNRTDLCYYHQRFGKNAQRCNTEQCMWEQNAQYLQRQRNQQNPQNLQGTSNQQAPNFVEVQYAPNGGAQGKQNLN